MAVAVVSSRKLRSFKQEGVLEGGGVVHRSASAVFDKAKGDFVVREGVDKSAVAWGSFADEITRKGWGRLFVETNEQESDDQQAFAAGLVEGFLTHRQMAAFERNLAGNRDSEVEEPMRRYFRAQSMYVDREVARAKHAPEGDKDGFWHQTGLVWRQFEGLVKGYNRYREEGASELDAFKVWRLNMDGDNIELEGAIKRGTVNMGEDEGAGDSDEDESANDAAVDPMAHLYDDAGASMRFAAASPLSTAEETAVWERKMLHSRCSAIVKLVGGSEATDLLVAHTSWEDYGEMMRIYKHYHFKFTHPSTKARLLSMSSYPGMVSSTDDWYQLSSGLLVTETTVNLMNDDLYARMRAQALPSWVRSIVASRAASDGPSWAKLYSRENSGTYNCHWMVVDYNKFTPGAATQPDNLLYVVETVPGLAVGADLTEDLVRRTYWPSVNRPYFKRIRKAAGYRLVDALTDGVDMLSFEHNPRGQQLAALQKTVTAGGEEGVGQMQRLIRHNDAAGDRIQRGRASYSVAARYDLESGAEQNAYGATDAKVVSAADMKRGRTYAVSGPTTDGNPPFSFTGTWASIPHEGMPETYDFGWEAMAFKCKARGW